jgi:hypothetical protein
VTVGVERYGDVGVPEHLRDDLGVYAPREQQRRTRVPEVVEAYVGQAARGVASSACGGNCRRRWGCPGRSETRARTPSRSRPMRPAARPASRGTVGASVPRVVWTGTMRLTLE